MTTAQSPLSELLQQADRISAVLKAAERGDRVSADVGGKIAAARTKPSVIFVVAMDDKILKIEMPWTTIRDTSRAGIAEWILGQMLDRRDLVH